MMSARVIWEELVRRRRTGQVVVSMAELRAVHYLAPARIAKMARQGAVERVGPGRVRIADRALPPDLVVIETGRQDGA
jgi:predicted transcriptional regulator of viral defense system